MRFTLCVSFSGGDNVTQAGSFLVLFEYPYTELAKSGTVYGDSYYPNQTGIIKGL